MRQAQYYEPRPAPRAFRTAPGRGAPPRGGAYGPTGFLLSAIGLAFRAAWWVVTLPFRVVFGAISLLGRATGVAVGFALMVVGMALGAGPFFLIGIPLFLVGLLLTLRCLG